MELKLTSIIDILKQEINPNRPKVEDMKATQGTYVEGVQHCIDLLTKISEVKEENDKRTYFEFKECIDNLVLLIPHERSENFLSYEEEEEDRRLKELADDLGDQEYLNNPLVA